MPVLQLEDAPLRALPGNVSREGSLQNLNQPLDQQRHASYIKVGILKVKSSSCSALYTWVGLSQDRLYKRVLNVVIWCRGYRSSKVRQVSTKNHLCDLDLLVPSWCLRFLSCRLEEQRRFQRLVHIWNSIILHMCTGAVEGWDRSLTRWVGDWLGNSRQALTKSER